MKQLICLLALAATLFALEVPKNGQAVLPIKLPDQHGTAMTLSEAKVVIYLPDEKSFDLWKRFMQGKSGEFLESRGVHVVADLSNAPSFVRSLFILPGLRKLNYTVLVVEDEFSPVIFESTLEKVSAVRVEEGAQKGVSHLGSLDELEVFFKEL